MFKAAEAEHLRLRQQLIAEGRHDPLWPAEYAEDTYECARAFVYKCRTYNEANKKIESIKEKAYIDFYIWHWMDTRAKGQPIATWKSRRLVLSWVDRALDLWDAGLAMSSQQIGAKTYEGVNGSEGFVWRCWFIYHQLQIQHPEWKLPKATTSGNVLKQAIEALYLTNGSKIEAVNSEKESFRGSGATRATCEELPSYAHVAGVFAQALFVTQGQPGEPGGHVVAIGNTSNHAEWLALKARSFVDPSWPDAPAHCEAWESPEGVRILKIHFYADPEKDARWEAVASKGQPKDEWQREMHLDESIEDGLPVYPDYTDEVHCPPIFRKERIKLVAGSIYLGIWDAGQTLSPAFSLWQITPKHKQVHIIGEVCSYGGQSMTTFAPIVAAYLNQYFPQLAYQINHWGDATITTRSGTDGRSAKEAAHSAGFSIRPVWSNAFKARTDAGAFLCLRELDGNLPGLLIDGTMCPNMRSAVSGKYKYKTEADPEEVAPGKPVYFRNPLKNFWSNIGDTFGYGGMVAQRIIEGKSDGKTTGVKVVETRHKASRQTALNPLDPRQLP